MSIGGWTWIPTRTSSLSAQDGLEDPLALEERDVEDRLVVEPEQVDRDEGDPVVDAVEPPARLLVLLDQAVLPVAPRTPMIIAVIAWPAFGIDGASRLAMSAGAWIGSAVRNASSEDRRSGRRLAQRVADARHAPSIGSPSPSVSRTVDPVDRGRGPAVPSRAAR